MTSEEGGSSQGRPVHGQPCYLQIPALDLWRSAEFYERIFGWRIERPYPSFEAPGMIGQWVDDRIPAPEAGPLLWINVDQIDATLALVVSSDCQVLQPPWLDEGVRWLATISDPARNTVGVFQFGPR
ncbi:MAG: Glyoxalase/bleomycin resistance protein/dioxygenase [Acidimicrobiaceae bacterium]|nr:Glyoxalase/bleomycin resistance protein/dioxygenase [Acidimicrobiaceae bacterium]